MKLFGKKPAVILAAGSFALAMTSCKQVTGENNANARNEASVAHAWIQLMEKISKTLRGGFGNANQSDSVRRREEDEDGGAGG
jgi:hypothetical protein